MGRKSLEAALLSLREGSMPLGEFFRVVDGDLRRMAAALHGRWVLPPGVEPLDVFQEMSIYMLSRRPDLSWMPGTLNKRGQPISISTFVLYHLHVAGKRWINATRQAKRRSGKAMGRFPICMTALIDTDDEDYLEIEQAVEATQDVEVEASVIGLEVFDELPVPVAITWAVYVQEGDVYRAAKRITASVGLASTCHVSTIEEATSAVKRAVEQGYEIARRMTA